MLVIALSCLAVPARADSPRDDEVARRVRFIERRLDEGTGAADRWWYAWYSIYVGLTVGQAAIAVAASDPGLRIDNVVGALTTSLGVVPLGLSPLEARFAADRLQALPESTPAERRTKLRAAETVLRTAAEEEQLGRSWLSHLLGNGVSLAGGIILGVGYDRPTSGIINFAAGVALTEIQILTQPTRAIEDWRAYRRLGALAPPETPRRPAWTVAPSLGGVAFAGSF